MIFIATNVVSKQITDTACPGCRSTPSRSAFKLSVVRHYLSCDITPSPRMFQMWGNSEASRILDLLYGEGNDKVEKTASSHCDTPYFEVAYQVYLHLTGWISRGVVLWHG
jgi:hypothetical protein